LNGWFPKLGNWAGRVLYFDTHAGRGKHLSGEFGSPLIALETLLKHNYLNKLLPKCEFSFFFIERDETNAVELQKEIAKLGTLPKNILVNCVAGDCFAVLREILASLRTQRSAIAPAFVFVDPYGFRVPGSLLRELMQAGRVELFVNVIWRELDMAIAQARASDDRSGLSATLDAVFDGDQWRIRVNDTDFDQRARQAIDLLAERIGAKWATHIRMLGDNNVTRYLLVHLTNHDSGRELMTDCLWKVCPDGGFYVRKYDDPRQELLITLNPNLLPLREWVISMIRERPRRWRELHALRLTTIWRAPQLNEVIRALRNEHILTPEAYSGKFNPSSNPLLRLSENSP
jgi:three-Cys-motif partner protein